MKNIHELLSACGITVPEDRKEAFDRELAANYKTVADYEKQTGKLTALTAERDSLQSRLSEANGKLEGYDPEWKQKAQQAQEQADKLVAAARFDYALEGAITAARGRNAKAIRALLDVETLQSSKNQTADIQSALDKLKQESGYLFDTETPPPYAGGTGTKPPEGGMDAAMRSAFGLPPLGKN